MRVKRNAYSVSSKYIGLELEVLIHQDHLELWYRNECLERMPRQFGQGKERIDFRHVIDSLVRKPGAFRQLQVRQPHVSHDPIPHGLRPVARRSTTKQSAVKQYLKILHAAKHEGLGTGRRRPAMVPGRRQSDHGERSSGGRAKQTTDPRPDGRQRRGSRSLYVRFSTSHKDVYDEQATRGDDSEVDRQDASIEESRLIETQLAAYDRHVEAAGSTEGTAAADVPGAASTRLPNKRHESSWTHTQFLADLAAKECQARHHSRIVRLMRNSPICWRGRPGINSTGLGFRCM